MYGGRRSKKPKVFDPVAEAARPQLACSGGAGGTGPRKTGRAANSAAMSSADLCCDKCETWYTTQEVGLSVDAAKALRVWHCGICLGTHKSRDAKGKAKKAAAVVPAPVEKKRPCPPPGPPPSRVTDAVSPAPPTHQPPPHSPRETAAVSDVVSSPGLQQSTPDTRRVMVEGEDTTLDGPKMSAAATQPSVAAIIAAQTAAIQKQWKHQQSATEGKGAVEKVMDVAAAAGTPQVSTAELDTLNAEKEMAEKPEDKHEEEEEREEEPAQKPPAKETPAAVAGKKEEEETAAVDPAESTVPTPAQADPDATLGDTSSPAAPPNFTVGCFVFMKFEESDGVLRDFAGRVDEIAEGTRLMKITFEDGGTETDVDPADPDLRLRAPKRMYGKQVKGAAPDAKKMQPQPQQPPLPPPQQQQHQQHQQQQTEEEAGSEPTASEAEGGQQKSGEWSTSESEQLRKLVEEQGTGRWAAKALSLGTGRSAGAVAQHYSLKLARTEDADAAEQLEGTEEQEHGDDDERSGRSDVNAAAVRAGGTAFLRGAATSGSDDDEEEFDDFADDDETKKKTTAAAGSRSSPPPVRGGSAVPGTLWSLEEDAQLSSLVDRYGVGDWAGKAEMFATPRTASGLRKRWVKINDKSKPPQQSAAAVVEDSSSEEDESDAELDAELADLDAADADDIP